MVRQVRIPPGCDQVDHGSSFLRYGDGLLAVTRGGGVYVLDPLGDAVWRQIAQHACGVATIPATLTDNLLLFVDE